MFQSNFHFARVSLAFRPQDFPMSVRQVATMTFYFTRRLVFLPFHPQNVTRDLRRARREAYENVIPSSLELPIYLPSYLPTYLPRHHPGRCRFAFFELTTLQLGFILRRGCIRSAEECQHVAPCARARGETENRRHEERKEF